jgi:anti-sigma B factor antagonist
MVAIHTRGGVTVAALPADVDVANADLVRDEIALAVPNRAAGLVIDLGATRYLDSAGIEVLFHLREQLANRRQRLSLRVPAESHLIRVLKLTGVDRVIPIHPDLAEALAGVGGAEAIEPAARKQLDNPV